MKESLLSMLSWRGLLQLPQASQRTRVVPAALLSQAAQQQDASALVAQWLAT